jgi:putative DNA primase/helicase
MRGLTPDLAHLAAEADETSKRALGLDNKHGGNGHDACTLPSPQYPMPVARRYVSDHCMHLDALTLRHWRGGWWQWRTSHWVELEDHAMRSLIYGFTEHAAYEDAKGHTVPWAPTRRRVGDVLEALAAICFLPEEVQQPCWIYGKHAGTIVALANGLLDVQQHYLLPHSPLFFNQTAVPFDYDPSAPVPKRWLQFLEMLWPTELEAIAALGEWFGYVISGRTDLHKILLMVGPTRGGKGVIARVLTALVGRKNVAGPTLNSLGGEFGLAPLIGKSLAIVSDARFADRNSSIVVERLLSISGEDALTVNRKYREQWTGKLASRLHVISNELPRLGDASGAIVGRMVVLLLANSWLGKEDYNIEPDVCANEMPGVLNWALGGLRRLVQSGDRFTRAPSSDDAILQLNELASPVRAFVRERCTTGANERIAVELLYQTYKEWTADNGHPAKSKQLFGRDLRAAFPGIRTERPGTGEDRVRTYVGIKLGRGCPVC